jgi:hypothetical protein
MLPFMVVSAAIHCEWLSVLQCLQARFAERAHLIESATIHCELLNGSSFAYLDSETQTGRFGQLHIEPS